MTSDGASDLSYADTLWKSADALRGQVDATEGKLGGAFQRMRDKTVTSVIFTAE